MTYRAYLRIELQKGQWMTLGEPHILPWKMRDLVGAASGWEIMNQQSAGNAAALIPKLNRGILELTNNASQYIILEVGHGIGATRTVLQFLKSLLKDCESHPFTEVYGELID